MFNQNTTAALNKKLCRCKFQSSLIPKELDQKYDRHSKALWIAYLAGEIPSGNGVDI